MRFSFRLIPLILLGLTLGSVFAQDAGENKLLALMPELRKLPGPDWVREGLRVTYRTAAATLPAERFYWYKNERGDWQKGEEVGPAGGGFTQYTVVVRSESGVVGVIDNYMQDIGTGIIVPSAGGGTVDPAGAGACWANPAALAKADRFQSATLLVMKAPYPLNGQVYKTIRFHTVSDSSVLDNVYDLDTGLLLFYGSVVLSADRRHTQLTQMTFLARRQVNPPVANAPAPDWMANTRQMRYQGQVIVHMGGMPQFPLPSLVTLQKTDGGARWAKYVATVQTQGALPSPTELVCGAGGLPGEPWVSPALLEKLQPGQVLDEDPQIGMVTRVDPSVPGPRGGQMVVITQEGRGFKRSRAYDPATGRMLGLNSLQQVGQAIQQTQLQWVE